MYAVEPRDHYERTIVNEMELAAKELGYRLVPLTQDKNDSGRLSDPHGSLVNEIQAADAEPAFGEGEL